MFGLYINIRERLFYDYYYVCFWSSLQCLSRAIEYAVHIRHVLRQYFVVVASII